MRIQKSGAIINFLYSLVYVKKNVFLGTLPFWVRHIHFRKVGRGGPGEVTYQCLKKFTDPV